MSRLAVSRLTVRRGGRTLLDGVSAAFPAGAFVAVVGPNGAGKSTLLAALAGLIVPDAGEVTMDGRSLAGIGRAALARRRAYLPQNPRCEWPISVERLVALGLTPSLPAFGGLPAALAERVERALEACDLTALKGQAATTLSGGELARAMLARTLAGDPEVLIADEPTAGLDPRHALDSMVRLQALAREGRLVVAALHDLTLAARFSTDLLALRAGRVEALGPTAATLTADLLERTFDMRARVSRTGEAAVVDFQAPAAR